jgi:hypothetical protein
MASPSDQARTEERRSRVFQMKLAGATNEAIANQLGVSTTQVHKDFHSHISNVRRSDEEAVNTQWALHMERYDRMLLRWWETALTADHEQSLQATNMLLKIMERQEKISGLIPDKSLLNVSIFQQNISEASLEEAKVKMANYLPIIRDALRGSTEEPDSTTILDAIPFNSASRNEEPVPEKYGDVLTPIDVLLEDE